MTLLFTSLIIITCILLVIIILVQNPKGGGLSSSFGGSGTQLFGGVKKTTDFLDRGTWTLSIILVVLVLAMNVMISPRSGAGEAAEPEVMEELNQVSPQLPVQQTPPTGVQNEDLPEPVEDGGQ